MPVFTEFAASAREQRVLRSLAPPLPRLTPPFQPQDEDAEKEQYEVLVVGAGPAGLLLTLLLARYGLTDSSLLCIDSKPAILRSGQADGLQPRTLEVFKQLHLSDELLTDGCRLYEVAFWNPSTTTTNPNIKYQGITRTSIVPDITVPTRFPFEVTLHQGRVERILEDDLRRYSPRGISRSTTLKSVQIDTDGNAEFPVLAHLEKDGVVRSVRAKYLVGADGAHSVVRRSMGVALEGESTDYVWGVVDFVAETDFPDIRRRTAIHSASGSVMVIPRERIASGEYLTRLYVQVPEGVVAADGDGDGDGGGERRAQVTLEGIFEQARLAFAPYYVRARGEVDWWAAYQIGQRVARTFEVKDGKGVGRVLIVGDACHTHSPKAGQGMNVSMMDSYNLAWKLAYRLHGLTPDTSILDTYHIERSTIAQELIEFDRTFSSMFSGKMGENNGKETLSHEQFLTVFNTGNGFTSGCGIEYPENQLVDKHVGVIPEQKDYLSGILRPGRRLLNVTVKRHADGSPRDLQDNFYAGRIHILVLTSGDLLSPVGVSASTINTIGSNVLPSFPESVVELIVIHPRLSRDFVWEDVPETIKDRAEMQFYDGVTLQDVYPVYGVPPEQGILAVIRPDGYVGTLARLDDVDRIEKYLRRFLQKV
ncbi:FAD binding domain-containing protein [Aspergillus alliaceus]|uniref:FAD binding domain-containing protein n=1 Tax=Petromyces alliaceus TaxID=209559 RepID=UPI0012A4EC0B|nr:FAD binding domain-containing protein [Aspergillus alliaceus]KAB8239107.1 FAD binding domain-containing protein [Aspergillus alliaceus]